MAMDSADLETLRECAALLSFLTLTDALRMPVAGSSLLQVHHSSPGTHPQATAPQCAAYTNDHDILSHLAGFAPSSLPLLQCSHR
jgi:hypothetical protein